MKIFQTIEKSFGIGGIHRPKSFGSGLLTARTSLIIAVLWQNIVFSMVFLMVEANNFGEYCESLYHATTSLTNVVFIMEFTRNTNEVFDIITNYEKFIEKRKTQQQKKKRFLEKFNFARNFK